MKKSKPRATKLARALQYAKKGFAVVPMQTVKDGFCSCSKGIECPNPGKHPRNVNGVKGASTNRKQIHEWWNAHPDANIGIACGSKSNILAIDIDPRNGGNETLRRLEETLGNLNSTVVSITGGGGTHHIFRLPTFKVRKDSGGKVFGPGIDVASEGAIIVVPPSLHPSGKLYRWQTGASLLKNTPGGLPTNWRNHIKTRQKIAKPATPKAEVIVAGARNDTLTSLAGRLHNTGISAEALLAALLQENQRCEPPLDKEEVERIA